MIDAVRLVFKKNIKRKYKLQDTYNCKNRKGEKYVKHKKENKKEYNISKNRKQKYCFSGWHTDRIIQEVSSKQ